MVVGTNLCMDCKMVYILFIHRARPMQRLREYQPLGVRKTKGT